jgi:hypothetical protein
MANEWNRLGNTQYERRTLYDWDGWGGTASNGDHRERVVSACNGGPVAVVAETHQGVVQARVFNAAGGQLSRVAYEGGSPLVEIGWTRNEVRTEGGGRGSQRRTTRSSHTQPISVLLFFIDCA